MAASTELTARAFALSNIPWSRFVADVNAFPGPALMTAKQRREDGGIAPKGLAAMEALLPAMAAFLTKEPDLSESEPGL
jgi:hypothetical protein